VIKNGNEWVCKLSEREFFKAELFVADPSVKSLGNLKE
jgi:hypothetical protein